MKRSEETVGELASDLKPFKFVYPARSLSSRWCAFIAVLITLAMLAMAPFRPEFGFQLQNSPRLLFELLAGFALFFMSIWTAFALSVPGERTKALFCVSMILLSVYAGLTAYSFVEPATDVSMSGKRPYCFEESLFWGAVFIIVSTLFVRRRVAVRPVTTGLLIAVSGVSLTSALMLIGCMYEPYHILTHHIAPIIPLSLFAIALGFVVKRRL